MYRYHPITPSPWPNFWGLQAQEGGYAVTTSAVSLAPAVSKCLPPSNLLLVPLGAQVFSQLPERNSRGSEELPLQGTYLLERSSGMRPGIGLQDGWALQILGSEKLPCANSAQILISAVLCHLFCFRITFSWLGGMHQWEAIFGTFWLEC